MKKIGFIVNPVAGIGGKVGLKGSDGADTLARALSLGAVPESGRKALAAMTSLKEYEKDIDLYTYPGEMGEDILKAAGLHYTVLGSISSGHTTAGDTIQAAKTLCAMHMDLIVFAGGDGTARNIMDAVGTEVTALGIPTGCKIHSGVYALNPRTAGLLIGEFAQGRIADTKEAEVMDIDEERFRSGIVEARLYGYLRIPNEGMLIQNQKSGSKISESESVELIADYLADTWQDDILYIVGTGSTTAAVMKKLGLPNTLLGVDLVYGGKVLASDCTEKQILDIMGEYDKVKIIVTVIGGQGYIFGRGNQQISAEVIRRAGRENIIIIASRDKILSLGGKPLYVDTGDESVNSYLKGYMRVIVGYEDVIMAKVSD